jgi:hypothetical protein
MRLTNYSTQKLHSSGLHNIHPEISIPHPGKERNFVKKITNSRKRIIIRYPIRWCLIVVWVPLCNCSAQHINLLPLTTT